MYDMRTQVLFTVTNNLRELIKNTYSQYLNIVLIKNTEKCFDSIPLMVPAIVFEYIVICIRIHYALKLKKYHYLTHSFSAGAETKGH